jgi:hypothetical protein
LAKLNKAQLTKMLNVANETLKLIGRTDYAVKIEGELLEHCDEDDPYSRVCPNIWRKTLEIEVFDRLLEKDWDYIEQVIIHEVIHGMFGVMQDEIKEQVAKISYLHEETFVNSMTTAIQKAMRR